MRSETSISVKCSQMAFETVWSKNIFIDETDSHLFTCHKIWRFSCTFWSVWRDLREAKCVDLVVNYMKIFKFLWISTSFKVFKALRRLPKRLKTLELRSGDTHKNSNVPQMLLAFEETVWSKIFLLMNGSITFEFLCPQKFEDFHAHFA